jgi:hypothetical protein
MAATALTAMLDGGTVAPGAMPGATASRLRPTHAALASATEAG